MSWVQRRQTFSQPDPLQHTDLGEQGVRMFDLTLSNGVLCSVRHPVRAISSNSNQSQTSAELQLARPSFIPPPPLCCLRMSSPLKFSSIISFKVRCQWHWPYVSTPPLEEIMLKSFRKKSACTHTICLSPARSRTADTCCNVDKPRHSMQSE